MEKRRKVEKRTYLSGKAFVFNDEGQFLIMRRTKTAPVNPLGWDLPGGIVEYGENPKTAIMREIKEETGLKVKELTLIDIASHIYEDGVHWVDVAYRSKIASGKLASSWEHDLHQWVTVKKFLKLKLTKRLRNFATAMKMLSD